MFKCLSVYLVHMLKLLPIMVLKSTKYGITWIETGRMVQECLPWQALTDHQNSLCGQWGLVKGTQQTTSWSRVETLNYLIVFEFCLPFKPIFWAKSFTMLFQAFKGVLVDCKGFSPEWKVSTCSRSYSTCNSSILHMIEDCICPSKTYRFIPT